MSEKTPVRVNYDNSGNAIGFAELQAAEFIGLDDGGTGATTASGARTALGLSIGTDILGYDADLAAIAGLSHSDGNFIVSNGSTWIVESGSTARDSLGLGTSNSPTFTNLTISNDLTVTGDLTVQGDTTTINTATVTVEDVLMKLADNNTTDAVDIGWYGEYVESSTTKYLGFTWDASADKFILWTGNQSEPNTLVDTGATGHSTGTLIANIEGNVTGTLSATSTLADGVVATTQSAGDSSTKVATTAYVDTAVASEDTLAEMNDVTFGTLASGDVLRYNGSVWINDPIDLATDTVGNFVEDVTAGDGLAKTSSASEGQTVDLSVNVDDSSIEISSDSLQVKASGITNAMLAGSIENAKLTNSDITFTDGTTATVASLGDTITFTGGTGVTIANTAGNFDVSFDITEVKSQVDEYAQDALNDAFAAGTQTRITVAYDDNANSLSYTVEDDLSLYDNTTSAFITASTTDTLTNKSIDLTNNTLTGTLAEFQTAVSDATLVDLDDAQTLTNKTIDSATNTLTIDADEATVQNIEVDNLKSGVLDTDLTSVSTSDDTLASAKAIKTYVDSLDRDDDLDITIGATTYTLDLDTEDLKFGSTGSQLTVAHAEDVNGNITVTYTLDDDLSTYDNSTSAFIDLTDLSGTSGVTYDNTTGQISIGQSVGTTDNVTFNNVTVDGILNSDDITATTMTVSNDLVVTGDLTVQGTTTTLNTDTVSTEENMIKLASGNIGNGTDIGIYGKVVQSSTTKYVGLHWDAGGVNKFKLFDGLTVEPTGTVDTADASYNKATLVADIEGDVTGALTGNADTATALASGQNFSLTGDVTASAISFDGTGAVALSTSVTESAVTQHEAALTITESQISDLQSYLTSETSHADVVVDGDFTSQGIMLRGASAGTYSILTDNSSNWNTAYSWGDHSTAGYLTSFTETNDLSSAVTWANVPDANITETSVTQHEAALSITESQISDLGSYITATSSDTLTNKTINFEDNTAIIEFAVTVSNASGSNKYYIDGELSANIQLIPGVTYRFDQSASSNSGHPLVLSTTSESAGVTSYTTGVTTNGTPGSSGAYTQIVVDGATADKLYYYCSNHSGMGGGIVSVQGISLVAGTGISISGETISTTITQYADSDVEAYLSGGTGVTFSSGSISIGQAVGTSDNVTFNDVTISGNLDVNGTTTTIDTTNTTVTDSIIELANGTTGTPANDAGLVIERGTADNAFIGFDESADKFIVGTGTFTGASTGNLTISTGTLVANLEGTVPQSSVTAHQAALSITESQISDLQSYLTSESNDLTSAVTWANVPDANITATSVRQHITGGDGITFSSGQIDVDSTIITGQSTYSGTVDTTNDFVLLYDASSTSLTKIAVSDLNAASGAGTMTDFTIAGDSGTNQTVADSNVLTFTGGTGIDTSIGGTDTVTFAIDNTVITTSSSIGDLSDVDITTSAPTNGQALVWNATNSEFEPGTVASSTNYFQTIAVSGQSDVVPDSTTDTLTFAAGSNITLTTDASTDTVTIAATDTNTQLTQEQVEDFVNGVIVAGANITKTYDDAAGTLTIAATGGAANAFSTLAVSGQSDVVADATTDTLTLVEGTGMTITTDASTDTITFTSSGSGGGGTMPFTSFDGSTDNIILSSTATAGQLPVTLAGGSSDPIEMSATTATLTSYADSDNDTTVEVERTTDNDTVHIKAGGTDVITATSSGVTITNLTVTGTTTQANELKITDTLFELNADGGSLTTDAGMIVERGSTGDNAAFIWDESTDSWVAGTTATDGSAAANLTVTEGTLKAATQSQGDNSTNVATTAYVDTATAGISSDSIKDADNDTKIEAEASSDADELVFTTGGQERAKMDNNMSMSARGGFFTHNLAMHASETFTIASTEGTVAAGPLDIQGTVDVQGSLVVL